MFLDEIICFEIRHSQIFAILTAWRKRQLDYSVRTTYIIPELRYATWCINFFNSLQLVGSRGEKVLSAKIPAIIGPFADFLLRKDFGDLYGL